ncbi:MAG: class I SAM-dependent methyltransferase [Myxococcota bacterium]
MPVQLGPVQETLLIPLLGRAEETKRRGVIDDPRAVEIVERLDYDFSKWSGMSTLRGASIRTRMFDDFVRAFLSKHPHGTVVEIGAGLNTRYERLDNGRAQWVELDLPDSMALRRAFFEDTDQRIMIDGSFTETDWHDVVAARPGPYCFVSEAVIIYLDEAKALRGLKTLAERFPGSTLAMDTTSSRMVERQKHHEAMKLMSTDSWFRWRCDDPASLEGQGLHLEESLTFMDASPELLRAMPASIRWMRRLVPWLLEWQIRGYRLNRFTLQSPVA